MIESDLDVIAGPARLDDPQGSEVQLNPDVAYDPSRDQWCVTWDDDSQSSSSPDIRAELVDADGVQAGAIDVENHTTAALRNPAVAYSTTSDRYLFCYESGSSSQDIVGRLYNGTLTSVVASPTVANQSGVQEWPDLAWNADADTFLCVYETDHQGNDDIAAQRLTAAGATTGSATLVASTSADEQGPAVAWGSGSNTFWVTFDGFNGTDWDVFGRELDATATAVSSVQTVSNASAHQFFTAVAYNPTDDQWLEVWEDGVAGTDYDIWGRLVETDATDTTAPNPPVITSPLDDSEVEDSTPPVTGTAEPNSTVEVLVGGSPTTPATTTTADGSGDWSVSLAQALSNGGPYVLTATATDAANNTSSPSTGVDVTVVDFTVTFSGEAFLLEPGGATVRQTTVSISDTGQTVTVKSTNPTKFKLKSGGVEVTEITNVAHNQVIELVGLEPGPGPSGTSTLRAETAGGTIKADEPVLTKALAFELEAQLPTRNAPFTAGGLADPQDGAFLDLGQGIFAWSMEVLPGVQGRNGLAPAWILHHNSRAYSKGGNFGVSPFDLFCFMRVRKVGSDVVWQESRLREYTFDTAATGGKTARARYEVVSESSEEVVLRAPDGSRLRFHPFDGSFTAGLLYRIENRFGDRIDLVHDAKGFLVALYDALGREWTFTYDDQARLTLIEEDATTLLERSCEFSYDAQGRLNRIDTTPVTVAADVSNEYANGSPWS